jgi:glucose-1-phosphate thymidylyltransferase
MKRKGIILAGGSGTRLYPLTLAVSKQLMPVYDKPMIYYPLSILMLAGIREILIITTPHDSPLFQLLLKDGSQFGVKIEYAVQPRPEGLAQAYQIGAKFVGEDPSCLILGDNLFYSADLSSVLNKASQQGAGATIFGYQVANPSDYGVVEFDSQGRAISLEEKPAVPKSDYAVPGLYFYDENAPRYASELKCSARGELEITDLNRCYMERGALQVQIFGRGTAWLDTGTQDSLIDASEFVKVLQRRQGLKIACLEEIAYERKWITEDQLQKQIDLHGKSSYAAYLRRLLA